MKYIKQHLFLQVLQLKKLPKNLIGKKKVLECGLIINKSNKFEN
jgi:phosphorylcholine metabolism protein LicD